MTPKQNRFVQEYLIDLNATQAAIRAGYSAKTADKIGTQLLGKTSVAEAITIEQEARATRTGITADRVLQEYAILGFSDLADFIEWKGQTATLKDSASLDKLKRRAISEITQTESGLKIKLHDKKGALDSVARHLGMFNDKMALTGKNGGPIQSETTHVFKELSKEQAEKIAREFLVGSASDD